jgi:endonuclease YncB( thermonuclease family)
MQRHAPSPLSGSAKEARVHKLIAWFIFAGAIFRSDPVLVTRVSNGDSITVATIGSVRLLGIEASSAGARERLESMVFHRWIRLEYDDGDGARASRHRAYVMLDTGEFVNETLVREGLARVVARGEFSRRVQLERAQREAQRFRRGIWAGYTRATP